MSRASYWVFLVLLIGVVGCGDASQSAGAGNMDDADDAGDAGDAGDALGDDSDVAGADAPEDSADPELPPQPWSVDEPGPYPVGYHEGELTYDVDGAGERTLRVVYWYPTFDEHGGTNYNGLYLRSTVHLDAAPAIDEPAPVLVFSHGSTSFAEQSFFMTEFFASHGFVVVAPDHTGNTLADRGFAPDIFTLRPRDITAVLDHVESLPTDHLLSGLFSDDIVISGHSFGGYTTIASAGAAYDVDGFVEACAEGERQIGDFCDYLETPGIEELVREGFGDERIDAAIPQAPFGGSLFGEGMGETDIPILLITGALDKTLPPEQDGDPLWEGMDGADDLRVDFLTGGHFTFSNACEFAPGIVGQDDGCGPSFIAYERAYQAINAYSLAFARHHLWGDDSELDLLEGERDFGTDIRLSTK